MIFAEPAPATQPSAITPIVKQLAASQPTEAHAIDVLRSVMNTQEKFVKVHAAEALIELGQPEGIHRVFIEQEKLHRDVPIYRIGICRALARATAGTPESDQWIGRIRQVAFDPSASDQMAAIESLAKLKYVVTPDERKEIEKLATGDNEGMALFSIWLLMQTPGGENPQDRVARYLESKDPITRLRAIFILRFLPDLSIENRSKLKAAARAEEKETLTYAFATSTAFIVAKTYNDQEESRRAHGELHRILQTGEPAAKQEACRALAEQGSRDDLDEITPLLSDPTPPARVGGALATARLLRQKSGH